MDKCLECSREFGSEIELHRHLRSHKIKIADYYFKHFPRFDKFDKTPIDFKNKEFYFGHDFNNRSNFRRWFLKQANPTLRNYCIDFLLRRKGEKKIIYAPCQVELRSLQCPSILGFNRIFSDSDYYKVVSGLGFLVQYESPHLAYPEELDYNPKDGIIWIDTREQRPLNFTIPSQLAALPVGDYAFGVESSKSEIVVERKSVDDFINSFGADFERIHKEFIRGTSIGKYIIVVIECDLKYVLTFNFLPNTSYKMKVTPEFVFHNVRVCCQEFPNVQFLFVKNRTEASRIIQKVLVSKDNLVKFDLQLMHDMDLL